MKRVTAATVTALFKTRMRELQAGKTVQVLGRAKKIEYELDGKIYSHDFGKNCMLFSFSGKHYVTCWDLGKRMKVDNKRGIIG